MNNKNKFLRVFGIAQSIIILPFIFGGCINLGSKTLKGERNSYNIAVQKTNDEQLLLNLVRLKYRDTPFFMEVSSIASQFILKTNIQGESTLRVNNPDIYGFGGGLAFEERPTVTYAPLQGDKFIKRVLSPVSLQTITLLYHSGWSVERIFRSCFQRLNKLKNAPGASGPTPSRAPDHKDFAKAAELLRYLQSRDALDIGFDNKDGFPKLVLQISPEALVWPETDELVQLVGVANKKSIYILSTNPISKDPDHIHIETRSLLGIMFYLSQSVEAPVEDQEKGKVTITKYPNGEPFDWKNVTGSLLQIKSQSSQPDSASVSINYRGAWFYIEDSDLTSKSTFSLLAQIFSLQAGKVDGAVPLLTLPVGQ